jgi:hypothetical protein
MARAPDANLDLLLRVAEALGELRERFVFVGGCATGLLITDPAAPTARPTRDGSKLDVMPTEEAILGFANRWYREAIAGAREVRLRAGLSIRLVTAPYFLATKYEAFLGRGRGDYLASHDFEDMIAVIDGRPELEDELRAAEPRLREHLADVMRETLADERFLSALGGFVIEGGGSPDRASELRARMERLADVAR